MKWICVLGVCWFLIAHSPAALSWYFSLGFFLIPLIFLRLLPTVLMLNSLCHPELGLEHLRVVAFFPNVNSTLLTLRLHPAGTDLKILHKGDKNHQSYFPDSFRYSGKPKRGALVESALSGASSSHMEITRVAR